MKARRYALILFSSMNRCGATEEADNPDEALKTAGNDVAKIEWSNVAEIHNIIDSAVSGMVAMASEFRSVDGKKDIGTMFTNAQGRGPQVPECGCYSLSVFHMIFRITWRLLHKIHRSIQIIVIPFRFCKKLFSRFYDIWTISNWTIEKLDLYTSGPKNWTIFKLDQKTRPI